jgi:hypothetical protein
MPLNSPWHRLGCSPVLPKEVEILSYHGNGKVSYEMKMQRHESRLGIEATQTALLVNSPGCPSLDLKDVTADDLVGLHVDCYCIEEARNNQNYFPSEAEHDWNTTVMQLQA